MAPRIVIVGGGSYQWVPKLVVDMLNTPSLLESELVLHDINPEPLGPMSDAIRHLNDLQGAGLTVETTTDRRAALAGADYVVVTISTGGFDSMRFDLEIPARHGIKQSVGDSVGPGGIMRALRNIPVLVDMARDMQDVCPDAWLLNITNPMTTLCRAVNRATSVKCVGLCHEIAGAQYMLSNLLDADFRAFDFDVIGVNHLPMFTAIRIEGEDVFDRMRELVADKERLKSESIYLQPGMDPEIVKLASSFSKADLLESHKIKFALLDRFGALPGAGDRHLAEFFPNFLTEESEWGQRWGVHLTTIEDREGDAGRHKEDLAKLAAAESVPTMPSGEMVAPLIDSFIRNKQRAFPLNLPNAGQVPDLPGEVVVEAMCLADANGLRGRDTPAASPALGEWLRRVSSSQEATVEAALTGNRDKVLDAMQLDPLAGRADFDHLQTMTDEMIAATKQWLPQFA
jgi:alpha-galactosidase